MGRPGEGRERKTYRCAFRVPHIDGGAVADQPLGGFDVFDSIERCISVFVGYIDVTSWDSVPQWSEACVWETRCLRGERYLETPDTRELRCGHRKQRHAWD